VQKTRACVLVSKSFLLYTFNVLAFSSVAKGAAIMGLPWCEPVVRSVLSNRLWTWVEHTR
jgi:hypothetical protein